MTPTPYGTAFWVVVAATAVALASAFLLPSHPMPSDPSSPDESMEMPMRELNPTAAP